MPKKKFDIIQVRVKSHRGRFTDDKGITHVYPEVFEVELNERVQSSLDIKALVKVGEVSKADGSQDSGSSGDEKKE